MAQNQGGPMGTGRPPFPPNGAAGLMGPGGTSAGRFAAGQGDYKPNTFNGPPVTTGPQIGPRGVPGVPTTPPPVRDLPNPFGGISVPAPGPRPDIGGGAPPDRGMPPPPVPPTPAPTFPNPGPRPFPPIGGASLAPEAPPISTPPPIQGTQVPTEAMGALADVQPPGGFNAAQALGMGIYAKTPRGTTNWGRITPGGLPPRPGMPPR